MAPIALQLFNDASMLNDLNGDNMDESETAWRICTKAKQALKYGSRLENRSWRRWFLSVQKHMKQQQPQAPVTTSLEIQYKRDLLLQQRKQYQQLLVNLGTTATTASIDNQYHQPSSKQPTLTPNTTTGKNDYKMACSGDSFSLPTTDNSHPAMYVASDDSNFLTVQHNTLQYLLVPHHQPSSVSYPTISTVSISASLALSPLSLLASSPTTQTNTNKKPKIQRHRLRRPLPVINTDKTVCYDCHTSLTPLWRRYQNKTLCNACGLYWKLHSAPRPSHLIPSMTQLLQYPDSSSQDNQSQLLPQCTNCGTNQTTLWRRNGLDRSPLCNACGLYAKFHQETRPLSMKNNVIKKRQRLY